MFYKSFYNFIAVLLLNLVIPCIKSATITWKPDAIKFSTSSVRDETVNATTFLVTVAANGQIFERDGGHFRLSVSALDRNAVEYSFLSRCLALKIGTTEFTSYLKAQNFTLSSSFFTGGADQVSIRSVSNVRVQRYYQIPNTTYSKTTFAVTLRSRTLTTINIALSVDGCVTPRTVGQWTDSARWSTGTVPTTGDSVVLPSSAGVIELFSDVTIASLTANGGLVMNYATSCPDDWSVDPNEQTLTGSKCYRLFQAPRTYDSAEFLCNAELGFGSFDAHLVQIRNRVELSIALRLCRGLKTSTEYRDGCWIGLRDLQGDGFFDWIEPSTVGSLGQTDASIFLDWRWNEPNNHTVSEGVANNGERCAHIIPWQEDPLIQEQGSWNDNDCASLRPFICQLAGQTTRHVLTVTGTATLNGGAIEGGILFLFGANSRLNDYVAMRSAVVVVASPATNSVIKEMYLEDGSALLLQTSAVTIDAAAVARIGESQPHIVNSTNTYLPTSNTGYIQPVVVVDAGVIVSVAGGSGHGRAAHVSAQVQVRGTLSVAVNTTLRLEQGGDLSRGSLAVADEHSRLVLAGYGAKLSAYDAFELNVSHRGVVIGEYYGNEQRDLEARNKYDQQQLGVYRLTVANLAASPAVSVTSDCIPYNASAAHLKEILDRLSLVSARGGVTVRRYGNESSIRYSYGYTYRIEMDAPPTTAFAQGSLDVTLNCYGGTGGNCNCAETKVTLLDGTGVEQCPLTGNYSNVDPNTCVLPPTIVLNKLSTLSYMETAGSGSVVVSGGLHRLPPVSNVVIATQSTGTGVVAADDISWEGLRSQDDGRLVLAGTGWTAWDSSFLLYAPEWTYGRRILSKLDYAPQFNMFANTFFVDGLGHVLASCPGSNLTVVRGEWAGGVIGGRFNVFVTERIDATTAGKSLRYGVSMTVGSAGVLHWTSGNISLVDASKITVLGSYLVDSANSAEVFIGESHLLTQPADVAATKSVLLEQLPGRSWNGYFEPHLPKELWGGWYRNPLCGSQCLGWSQLNIDGAGFVTVTTGSNATFFLPINLLGLSSLTIQPQVRVTIESGGICGDGVIIDISSGTTLILNGGQMLMGAACTIQGRGELLVTGGAHDLGFVIDAHITISGGTMLWPLSRGTDGVITFNGGLLMQNTGVLEVQPFSTTIVVNQEVELKDQCLIQFPLIGIATQASPFDQADAPDNSPRGNLTATGIMRWNGGSLVGKADINALNELYLDGGTKYIKSLAKLVNKGHCEWGTGDIIASDNGDFQNFGTIQMQDGVNAFSANALYKGAELPIEEGGDVFALEFHSWDVDQGSLDYRDYVSLRTQFVSRAPNGWNVSFQG